MSDELWAACAVFGVMAVLIVALLFWLTDGQ